MILPELALGASFRGFGLAHIAFLYTWLNHILGMHPAWSTHIRETLEATPGVAVEFIVRDVYTVHGNLNKPKRAVELARAQLEKHCRA